MLLAELKKIYLHLFIIVLLLLFIKLIIYRHITDLGSRF